MILILKITKGISPRKMQRHNSTNDIGDVTIFVFCTSSDRVLYLY